MSSVLSQCWLGDNECWYADGLAHTGTAVYDLHTSTAEVVTSQHRHPVTILAPLDPGGNRNNRGTLPLPFPLPPLSSPPSPYK